MIDSMNFSVVDHRERGGMRYPWRWDGFRGSDERSARWRRKLHFSLIDDSNFIMHVTLPRMKASTGPERAPRSHLQV